MLQLTGRKRNELSYLAPGVLKTDVFATLHTVIQRTITAQKAMLTISDQYLTISKLTVTIVFLYKLTLTLLWYTGSVQ